MSKNNFVCKYGHEQVWHGELYFGSGINTDWCSKCRIYGEAKHSFVKDNIKYLEHKAAQEESN